MNTQSQSQKQQHKALAHHVAMMNIFHLDTIGIEQLIRDEVNDNPLIDHAEESEEKSDSDFEGSEKDFENPAEEYDDNGNDYKMEYGNYLSQQNFPEKQLEESVDFRAELKKQFRIIAKQDFEYLRADFIIDSLNDKGFLEQDEESIAEEISFKEKKWIQPEELINIVKNIQLLDPQGCGCRDIREYLLFQLKNMNVKRPDVNKAICMLEQHFEDLKRKDFDKICNALNIEQDEIKILLELLAGLKKSPCSDKNAAWTKTNIIIPDYLISVDDDKITIQLNREYSDKLSVNESSFEKFIPEKSKEKGKHAVRFLKNKMASAKWFINAIRERETNMLKIMKAIADFQKDFFYSWDEMLLKPMGLKDIAQKVSLDISTVSRITSNKYAETPHGNIKLKNLFTKSIATDDGNNISNKVVHETIREMIDQENKKEPYTDKQLVSFLAERGIQMARRTVTKYREELNIPVAYKRTS